MITNIDKFSNLRFITSSLNPQDLIGKVLKDAQNSIIINTYAGHIGIFVCDGEGNIQRATAEFSNDFNIDGNVASISGAVNELKQQIKDLRDAFNSLSKNGGSVHVPLVTNPPLPKPISVELSPSNVTISDNNVVEVIITTTYDKNFRFPSDIIEPSISTGANGIMHDIRSYSKQNNVCQHKLRLSKNSNVERNNTIIVSVGNVQATLGVTVTKPNDVYAKITKIRTSVDNIVFNNDNTTATITVQKELSEGIRDDDNRLKTQIIKSDGITVDRVEYTATADTYYISPSVRDGVGNTNGSIKFGVEDGKFNSGVNNITVSVVDKRTVVSPSPSVTPTVPSAPKALRRISKVTVNNGEPITIKGGTTKEFDYTVTYNGRPEDTITDVNTDNIDIASNSDITVEVDKKRNKIRFTTNRTFDNKSATFNVMSNNTKVGEIKVNVAKNVVQRISHVTVNGGNPVTITAGTPTTVDYTVTYNGDVPDSNTDNIVVASKEGITVTIDSTNKTITFSTSNKSGANPVGLNVTSNSKVVGTVNVGVTALPLRRITEVTVNTTNSVQFKAGTDTVVNYTVTYNGDPEHTNSDGKEDNIEIVSKDGIDVGINYPTKQIMFSTESDLSAKSNISFDVISNSKKVGEFTVTVTAQEPKRISHVTVNGGNPVTITAGTDSIVSYSIDTYTGELPDYNTDIIAVASKDNIKVDVDKKTKTIKFRLAYEVITPKSVSFDVISNGKVVGSVNVVIRYNIVLTPIAKENPMILVQNRRVALSELAKITGTHGTLKCKSTDFVLEDAAGYLSFTENENKEGTITLYVDEDKTVEKSFKVKLYKFADPEIYPITEGLTDNNILEAKLPLKLGIRFPSDITFVNDNQLTKEIRWSAKSTYNNSFVPTITKIEDQNVEFRAPKNSDYVIDATVIYKYNNNIVYTRTIDKHIFVSANPVRRPARVTLSSNDIHITAGDSTRIQYTIADWTGIDPDRNTYNISVGPIGTNTNEIVGATVHSGDNQIVIGSKTTTTNKTVKFGIFNADNTKIGEFTVYVTAVPKHGLVLKEGVVTPLVLFKDNVIDYNNLVTVTNAYGNENEKLVVTSQDFKLGGASTSYHIIGDETKTGKITVSLPGDNDMSLDIDVQQYKRPEVVINEGNQTMFRNEKKRFTVTYHIDSDNIDARTRDEFRYEIEWSVRKEFNKQIIGTINQNTGEFIPQADGECTIEAKVKHFKLNNLIYIQTITRKVTVKASDNANYVLQATQPVSKVEINQFRITDKIGVSADVILTSTRNGNYEVPNVEVITNSGAPKAAINVYLTRVEGTNNCKLTIASATHSTTNGQNLKGATGIVKLTVGKGSRNEQNVEIPFVKNYDTPLNGIYAGDNTVVIRNTDKYKSATISGTIRYSDKVNNVVQRGTDGVVRPVGNLHAINTTLDEWNEHNPNDNKWNEWQIGKISSGDRFSIPVSVMYPNELTGYESKMTIYSEVDPNWSADVHLVYWNENGDNPLVEPTTTPSPVPAGDTSGSTPKP